MLKTDFNRAEEIARRWIARKDLSPYSDYLENHNHESRGDEFKVTKIRLIKRINELEHCGLATAVYAAECIYSYLYEDWKTANLEGK